jgi:lipid A 3-O-deacylase
MRHLVLIVALTAGPAAACADGVEEVRLGVTRHNICVLDCDNAFKEDGANISGEIVFASPDVLDAVGSPRPYVVASVNTAGDTSFGGAGLHWNVKLAEGWALEPGFGYVIHDGELSFPFPQGDPRNDPVSAQKVFFGSRDLFRTSVALTRDLGRKWGAQVMYEHLSHGQVLGAGRNQGIDNIGVRIVYRLGD